jgi:hypothetical protein
MYDGPITIFEVSYLIASCGIPALVCTSELLTSTFPLIQIIYSEDGQLRPKYVVL